MILHVVLYQPKASATQEELSQLVEALQAVSREISSIRQVRVGKAIDLGFGYSNWPKDRKNGNVAVFEFDDRSGLEAYLSHEAHKKLAMLFWNTCDQPTIVDVSAIDPRCGNLAELLVT